jgi:hypothetical protein
MLRTSSGIEFLVGLFDRFRHKQPLEIFMVTSNTPVAPYLDSAEANGLAIIF